uniref:Transmembrane protein n=1 Tax=Triticum urartu TaxID=4572 RepID=A0A8R7Q7F5_TRIUA
MEIAYKLNTSCYLSIIFYIWCIYWNVLSFLRRLMSTTTHASDDFVHDDLGTLTTTDASDESCFCYFSERIGSRN